MEDEMMTVVRYSTQQRGCSKPEDFQSMTREDGNICKTEDEDYYLEPFQNTYYLPFIRTLLPQIKVLYDKGPSINYVTC